MNKIKSVITKYWPEIVIASGWTWTQFGPAVTAFVQGHPKIASDIAAVALFLARMAGSSLKESA